MGSLLDIAFEPNQVADISLVQTAYQDEPQEQSVSSMLHVRVDDATVIAGITPAIWRRWLAMYAAGGDHRRRLAFEIVSPAYDYYIADIWPLLERHATDKPKAHPRCIETLLRLLDNPKHLSEVERYMQKYPNFDYGDVPARIAQLRRQEAAQ